MAGIISQTQVACIIIFVRSSEGCRGLELGTGACFVVISDQGLCHQRREYNESCKQVCMCIRKTKRKCSKLLIFFFFNPKYKTAFSSIQSCLPLDKNGSVVVSERVVISCPTRGLLSPPSNIPKTFTL